MPATRTCSLLGSALAFSLVVATVPMVVSSSAGPQDPGRSAAAPAANVHALAAQAAASLPGGCTLVTTSAVSCYFGADGASHDVGLSSGATGVTYTAVAGGGGGGGGDGHGDDGGSPGSGAVINGALSGVAGRTLHIGAGSQGHLRGTVGSDPLTTYGTFNGGGGGDGTASGGQGGAGGGASVIGVDSSLLVVAGAGGGGGGTSGNGVLGPANITHTGGTGGSGGSGGNRTGNTTGGGGGDGGAGSGAGGGGGGGGYWAGNNGGGGGVYGAGGGGEGGQNTLQNGATGSQAGYNVGDGYVSLSYARTAPSLSVTAPTSTVYAWQDAVSIPFRVTSAAGTPTGTVTVTDGGTQVCSSTLSNGSGTCTLGDAQLSTGVHALQFSYDGDSGYQPASSSLTLTVVADPVDVTLTPTKQPDGSYQLAAAATPHVSGGIVDGTLSVWATPDAGGAAVNCPNQTSPGPSDARRNVALNSTCIPALLPGSYTAHAAFTSASNISAAAATTQSITVDAYQSSVVLSFAPTVLDHYGASTTATVTVTPPSGTLAEIDGSVTVAPASGSGPSCTAAHPGSFAGHVATYTCTVIPNAGDQDYVAHFNGDSYYAAVTSGVATVSTVATTPTLTLTTSPAQLKVGDSLTLTTTVTDPDDNDVTAGIVTFYDGPVAPNGSNAVGSLDLSAYHGGGSITIRPSAGTHTYFAQYLDAAHNYSTVTVSTNSIYVQPLTASMNVTAVADSTHATANGIPTTVTVTVTMPTADRLNAPISVTPAPADPCVRSESIGTQRVITAVCRFVEQPGSTPTYHVSYTDDLVATLVATESSYRIPASPTTTTVTAASVDYGTAPSFAAVVTPKVHGASVSGTVVFTEGGSTLCTATIGITAGVAGASCSPSDAPHAGTHSVVASYTPDATALPFTTASTSTSASYTVRRDPVSITLRTSQTQTKLTVSVSAAVDGGDAGAPTPTGSIQFGDDVSACGSIALSSGLANCVIDLPAAGATATLSASYVPSADFTQGTTPAVTTTYQRPSSGPCSAGFAAFWDLAAGASGTFDVDAGALGQVHMAVDGGIGTCDAASIISLTGSVSLFGGTLDASGVTASVDQTSGLCVTDGSASLPSIWHSGQLSISQAICFPLTASGSLAAPSGGALTLHNTSGSSLPLLSIPGVTRAPSSITAQLDTDSPGVTVTAVVPSASTSIPGVTLVATVGTDGSISGSVHTTDFGVFGTSIHLDGTVSRSGTGTLSASVAATLGGAASPVPGLTIQRGATITLTGATGSSPSFTVDGTVRVADQVDVELHGSFTSVDDYSLDLDTQTPAPTWTPVPGLTFAPQLSGSLERSGGRTKFALSASGGSGAALATWNAPGGVTVTIDRISLGGDPTATDLNCPYQADDGVIAALSGAMSVGGLSVTASGCFSPADKGWHVMAGAKTAAVGGLALTDLVLDATHPAGGSTSVAGSATARLTVGSFSGSTTVTMSVENGVFVVGGQLDATSLGLPSTSTYLAYASDDRDGWQTGLPDVGEDGVVDLPAGVSLFGSLTLPSSVATVLRKAHFSLSADATVTFEAHVPRGAVGISFIADLATPSGFPLLTLPGGATIDSARISYEDGTFGLLADGTVRGQDGSPAPVHLDVSISRSGDFAGSASITGLSLLGRTLDLSGSVSRTNGVISANLTAKLTGTITLGDATLRDVTVSLGTDGLAASGSIEVASTSLDFDVSFASTTSYALTVSTTVRDWTPASGVTVNAVISGSLTRTSKGYSYDFAIAPVAGKSDLLTITPTSGVTLAMQSFELSNGSNLPSGCKLTAAGDTWLSVAGSLSLSLAAAHGTALGTGCFDLTKPAFTITVSIPGADFGGAGGKVTIGDLAVTVSKVGPKFTVEARTRLSVDMPSGGTFSLTATLTFGDDGFAIGGSADLSSFLGGSAAHAYLYYANAQLSVDTGDPTLGKLKLKPGVTVGLDFTLGADMATALQHVGIHVGAGSKLAATANIDLENATVVLTVSLTFQQTRLFELDNGTYLQLDSLALQMTLSPTTPSFGFVTSGTLHVPATVPGGASSDIGLIGGISIGTQLTAFLTVSNWNDALGLRGFNLKQFTLQGGITLTGLPLPSLAFSASVTGLPSALADVIGYQQGAPMSIAVALGETNLLLDVKIGTKDSTQVALAPFSLVGKASLLTVNYAELYISPTGATIGQDIYPPGFSLGFQGQIAGVSVDVFAKVNPVNLSFYFRGSVGTINVGSLVMGPTTLTIDVSPTKFQLSFSGHLSIGPSTTQIGPALRFTGHLNADVDLSVGTDGISAHLDFDASVVGSNYLPQGWCKWHGIWVLCDYEWVDDAPLTIHANNIGFSINSSGFTVDIPNTASSITFPWPHSPTSARERMLAANGAPLAQTLDVSALPGRATLLAAPNAAAPPDSPSASWYPTGAMGSGRIVAGGLALRDGSVLVAGGASSSGQASRTAELYNARTGGWTQTGSMHTARINPTLVELGDGRVLAVGGDTGHGETASAEIYDPKRGEWSTAGDMSAGRQGAVGALLPDGRVLVAGGHVGGHPVTTVDLFDPAKVAWQTGPSLAVPRAAAAAATLDDGRILVAGGMGADGPLKSVAVYDPTSESWTATTPMHHARFYAAATRLASGRVLVAGDAAQAETYDPATQRWTLAGSQTAPALLSSMTTLADGHVLVVGGLSVNGALRQVDEYDPATNHWTARTGLPDSRGGAVAALVPTGVLVTGGLHGASAAAGSYVYSLADKPIPVARYQAAPAPHAAKAASGHGHGWTTLDTIWVVVGVVLLLLAGGAWLLLVAAKRGRTT